MKQRHSQIHARLALTAVERDAAKATPVWVVWWEDPDKSWESLCLSPAESEKEYAVRQADHLIRHWGKVGKSDPQSLLAWLESHLHAVPPNDAEDFVNPAREVLRRVTAGETGPVTLRTW